MEAGLIPVFCSPKQLKMTLKETNELFAADLRDPTYAAGYLNIALEEDGVEGFLYALQKVARVHGMSQIAEKSDLPRESLYRSLPEKGNPDIKPLARVLKSLGLSLSVTPSVSGSR
jgi:probable addiction module antidote protein